MTLFVREQTQGMPLMKLVNYDDLRRSLKTGDIVLFAGSNWISRLIKFGTRGRWSHIGMVIKIPDYNIVLLWESTTLSKTKDIISGKARKGVQLVPLRDRLSTYRGEVAVRCLTGPINIEDLCKLHTMRNEVRGRPYEQSKLQLLLAASKRFCGFGEDLSSLFCSELVAEAYQRMGLLREDIPSNSYDPNSFAETGRFNASMLKNCLGPEIPLLPYNRGSRDCSEDAYHG